MKTSQSLQLLDTNDVNISPIIGVESLFYEKDDGTNIVKRKTLHDKMLFSEKDGSLSISEMSYDDASNLSIIVNLSTYVNEGDNPSLHRLGVSAVSMQDFMGVIDEKIEQGGGGGGFDPTNINASIRDISTRLANANTSISDLNNTVDGINTQIEEFGNIYVTNDKFNGSVGAINASLNKFDPSIKWLDSSVKKLWDSSNSGGGTIEGVRDVRVNNHSVVEDNVAYLPKIPTQLNDLGISDASINAWNNGGLTYGSPLGYINGEDFRYQQNLEVSMRDLKYGKDLPCGFSPSEQMSPTIQTLDISAGTILGFESVYYNCYMPINASANLGEVSYFVLNIDYPILVCAKTTHLNSQNPNFNDAYIYKTNVDLSDVYKLKQSGTTNSNDYALFPQMNDVYLKGEIYGNNPNLIKLDSSLLIVDNTTYLHKNKIDKNDSEKRFKYIHIGYTYTENFKYEQTPAGSTSKIHFYGGIPRVYYYDTTTQKLEPYNVKLNMIEDALFGLQGNISPRVDTLENSVSTIENSISTIESSVNKLEKSVYNVDYHYELDTSLSSWSYLFALLNDTQKMSVGVEREGILSGINILNIDLNQFWESRAVHEDTNYNPTVPLTIYLDDILFGDTDDMIADTFGKYGEKELEIRFIEDASLDPAITQVFRFAKIANDSSITLSYRYGQKTSDSSFNIISLHKNDLGYVKIRRIPDFSNTGVYKGHYIVNFN